MLTSYSNLYKSGRRRSQTGSDELKLENVPVEEKRANLALVQKQNLKISDQDKFRQFLRNMNKMVFEIVLPNGSKKLISKELDKTVNDLYPEIMFKNKFCNSKQYVLMVKQISTQKQDLVTRDSDSGSHHSLIQDRFIELNNNTQLSCLEDIKVLYLTKKVYLDEPKILSADAFKSFNKLINLR